MARINGISIPGVTAQKDWRGNIMGVTVNFKRCSNDILSFFTSLGVYTEKHKTSFEKSQEDIRCGRVFTAKNGKDLINQCLQ